MLPFCVFSKDSTDSVMIFMISLTGEELTFESHFLFFSELFSCKGNSLSAFRLKISGPEDFFPSLKWQLQTLEYLLGSLSALLRKKFGNL